MTAETLKTVSGKSIQGPLLITPQIFGDPRGYFFESWNERRFSAELIASGCSEDEVQALRFRQDNHSRSSRGVLRLSLIHI